MQTVLICVVQREQHDLLEPRKGHTSITPFFDLACNKNMKKSAGRRRMWCEITSYRTLYSLNWVDWSVKIRTMAHSLTDCNTASVAANDSLSMVLTSRHVGLCSTPAADVWFPPTKVIFSGGLQFTHSIVSWAEIKEPVVDSQLTHNQSQSK